MQNNPVIAITPKYMETFHCIGSECEETCCSGWIITIDKPAYKKYRTIPIKEMRDKAQAILEILPPSSNPDNYAKIKLSEDGNCLFLDEKGWCEVHSKLGSDYLSHTCQTYPKHHTRINDDIHLYASVSCSEAARKVLLSEDSMVLTKVKLDYKNVESVYLTNSIKHSDYQGYLLVEFSSYIFDTARVLLSIQQFQSWQSMIGLGLLVNGINNAIASQDYATAKNAIIDRLIKFNDPNYLLQVGAMARDIKVDRSKQVLLLRKILRLYFTQNIPRSSFKQTVIDAMDGIQFDENDLVASEQRYCEAEEQWFKPFDEQHPHLLKNYLMNDLGKNMFPIGKKRGLETEFFDLAVRYSLIKMLLVGMSALKKENFSASDYVRVVYTFSRNVEHNPVFITEFLTMLEDDGQKNLASATLMMR